MNPHIVLDHQASLLRGISKPGYMKAWKEFLESEIEGGGVSGDYSAEDNVAVHSIPLFAGEPYFWAAPICGLVSSASMSIPNNWTFRHEAWPSPSGFMWLEAPHSHEFSHRAIQAIGWVPCISNDEEDKSIIPVTFNKWEWGDESILVTFWLNDGKPPPLPRSTYNLPQDMPLSIIITELAKVPDSNAEAMASKLKLLASMLAFLEQKILVRERVPSPRAVRRRLNIQEPEKGLVNVVKLRRVLRSPSRDSSMPVDWSCQWLVSGHWRDQWYPKSRTHRPTWIMPHVKGPPNKPFRGAERIFHVVR